jgi:hypothetical protein
MKASFFTLALLALAGCGKSEVDKCVEAFVVRYVEACNAGQFNFDCKASWRKAEEEANARVHCLNAASRN